MCIDMIGVIVLTEAVNGDGSLAVVLDDLVLSGLSTSALDHGIAITLEGQSILADVDPPDVLDGAGTLAVDALDLVLANDGVLESATVRDLEDGVLVSTLCLASARDTTAVSLHASIESASDYMGRLVGNRALGGRDGKRSTLVEVEELSGGVGSRASGNGCDKRGDGESESELHVVD
jgi:hypothetical protein